MQPRPQAQEPAAATVSKSPSLPFAFDRLSNSIKNFKAGKTALAIHQLYGVTSDRNILASVRGIKLDFWDQFLQTSAPNPIQFSNEEEIKMQIQIDLMLRKGIIEETWPSEGQFVSNNFCRPKKDGSVRIILNLKQLNKAIEYHHFKMETLNHAIQLMTPGCFMASIDLKDAYYSIPIAESDRKYLKFFWKGSMYQFTCLPNGLSEAPRKFTKILKVPFSVLRSQGHENSAYIDDCFIGTNFRCLSNQCQGNSSVVGQIGVYYSSRKVLLHPISNIGLPWVYFRLLQMTVRPTQDKIEKVMNLCVILLNKTGSP